jgi:hypothetical protein
VGVTGGLHRQGHERGESGDHADPPAGASAAEETTRCGAPHAANGSVTMCHVTRMITPVAAGPPNRLEGRSGEKSLRRM